MRCLVVRAVIECLRKNLWSERTRAAMAGKAWRYVLEI